MGTWPAETIKRISAAGGSYDVVFAPADPAFQARIDAAYHAKYSGSPYLPPMVAPGPQSATVEITPRTVTAAG
jgi:hypothetical protein